MTRVVFVIDDRRRVVGVLTDGDIRHAFVRGLGLHAPVHEVMTRSYAFGEAGMTPAELESRLPGRTRVMPMLDAEQRLVDFASGAHIPQLTVAP